MAVRRGRGSARDALSALDQVAAGGIVDDDIVMLAELADALADRDPAGASSRVAQACEAGRDAQLAGDLADHLRQAFLASVAPELVTVGPNERSQVEELARKMGFPPSCAPWRSGQGPGRHARVARPAGPPRGGCLIRLTHPEADDSPARALGADRAPGRRNRGTAAVVRPPTRTVRARPPDRPEAAPAPVVRASTRADACWAGSSGPDSVGADPGPAAPARRPASGDEAQRAPDPGRPRSRARPSTLGAVRREARSSSRGAGRAPPAITGSASTYLPPPEDATSRNRGRFVLADRRNVTTAAAPATALGGHRSEGSDCLARFPSRDELVQVWGDGCSPRYRARARARFRVGRFVDVETARPSSRCPTRRTGPIAKRSHRGRNGPRRSISAPVPLRLVVDDDPTTMDRPARPPPECRARSRGDRVAPTTGLLRPTPTSRTCSIPASWRPRPSRPGPG